MVTKGYNLSVEDINASCPADLDPYMDAYNMEKIERDTYIWAAVGTYGRDMLSSTLDALLNGTKAKAKYTENALYEEVKGRIEESQMSEEELHQKELKEWVRQKRIAKINFDLWKIEQEKLNGLD